MRFCDRSLTTRRPSGLVLQLILVISLSQAPLGLVRAQALQNLVDEAYEEFKDVTDGAPADYIPELAKVPAELFGVAIVTAQGEVYLAGDVDYAFTIQSVSKPFTAALVMQEQGESAISDKIGVEPTGLPFNSIPATQILTPVSVNPLVNSGPSRRSVWSRPARPRSVSARSCAGSSACPPTS